MMKVMKRNIRKMIITSGRSALMNKLAMISARPLWMIPSDRQIPPPIRIPHGISFADSQSRVKIAFFASTGSINRIKAPQIAWWHR